jgi:hypothetical protein
MTYVYWIIIAGLVFNCVRYSLANSELHSVIKSLRSDVKFTKDDRDKIFTEYADLKAKIVAKASPEVRTVLPKRYTGPQLRVLNDRLNAQAGIQERPNSEILSEVANGTNA